MKFILQWLIGSLSLLIVAYIVPGITISSFYIALIVALIWGFISFFIKPILHLFALPITILTLGLFSLIINGLLFYFVSSFIEGFYIKNFLSAIIGAFLVSLLTFVLKKIFIKEK